MATDIKFFDCIVVGAGPGGLQASLHLARFNRSVLILDRGGGRTRHARQIVNYLGHSYINGGELIDTGLAQVKRFGVQVIKAGVEEIARDENFLVRTAEAEYSSSFVIGASGARDTMPGLKNMGSFFGVSIFTCVACDGYLTTDKKLVILGNSPESLRLALGMKQMYTDDITLVLSGYEMEPESAEVLQEENIRIVEGEADTVLGDEHLTGIRLTDSTVLEAEAVMLSLGATLNDSYLQQLKLKRNEADGKFLVNTHCESSQSGLYLTGSLCQGHTQAIIAAGQGAVAAIDINQKLLGL